SLRLLARSVCGAMATTLGVGDCCAPRLGRDPVPAPRNPAGDYLGIGGIEPVVGIGEAMSVPVPVRGIDARSLHLEQRNADGCVDVAGAAAVDRGITVHRQ